MTDDLLAGFEIFTASNARAGKVATATLQKRGILAFNSVAFEQMGEPEAVELLYNPSTQIIAVRPTDPLTVSHASAVRSSGSGENKTRLLSATAFVKYHGIDVSETVRRDIKVVDRVAFIDLKEQGSVVTGNRRKSESETTASETPGQPEEKATGEGPQT